MTPTRRLNAKRDQQAVASAWLATVTAPWRYRLARAFELTPSLFALGGVCVLAVVTFLILVATGTVLVTLP